MKKLIALVFAMFFLTVGIASATDFSLSGSYYARGTYNNNVTGVPIQDPNSFMVYDHELSVDATWQIDDATKVFARFEMADEAWGTGNINEGNGTYEEGGDVYLEQVWGAYTFAATGGTLTVGKMPAGAWGTAFSNAGDEAYRVKYVQPTAIGAVIGILEKGDNGETGNIATGETGDEDTYILGILTKAGDLNIKPLFVYADISQNHAAADGTVFKFCLALDGTFGNIGFESELVYEDWSAENGFPLYADHQLWGFYANVWANIDALKIGGLIAYGSEDEDDNGVSRGLRFGDDFEAGGALIMGDDIVFTGFFGADNDLTTGQLIAVYADFAVSEDVSVGGYLGYAKCGIEDNSAYEDADIWEISFDVTYKLTENLTYKVAAGRAELNWGDATPDPDASYEMYHRLDFSF